MEELSARRSAEMIVEVEAVALGLFDERGFADVTVDEIAGAAGISSRTFYRYFPSKEDILQVRIERRSDALRSALAARPDGEPPLLWLRVAVEEVLTNEDLERIRLWTNVIVATPSILRGVYGGIQLKSHRVMAEFFATGWTSQWTGSFRAFSQLRPEASSKPHKRGGTSTAETWSPWCPRAFESSSSVRASTRRPGRTPSAKQSGRAERPSRPPHPPSVDVIRQYWQTLPQVVLNRGRIQCGSSCLEVLAVCWALR